MTTTAGEREPGRVLQDLGHARYVLLQEQYGTNIVQYELTQAYLSREGIILMSTDMASQQTNMIELPNEAVLALFQAAQDYHGHMSEMEEGHPHQRQQVSPFSSNDDIPELLEDEPFS